MKNMEPQRPQETLRQLSDIFPSFAHDWAEEGMPPEDGLVENVYHKWTHHHVLQVFMGYFATNHANCAAGQIKQLGDWINAAVAGEGDLENAVSTCFLEHMHQVGISKVMSPHLSKLSKARSHA